METRKVSRPSKRLQYEWYRMKWMVEHHHSFKDLLDELQSLQVKHDEENGVLPSPIVNNLLVYEVDIKEMADTKDYPIPEVLVELSKMCLFRSDINILDLFNEWDKNKYGFNSDCWMGFREWSKSF